MSAEGVTAGLDAAGARPDPDAADWAPVRRVIDRMTDPEQVAALIAELSEAVEETSYRTMGTEAFVDRVRVNLDTLNNALQQRRRPDASDDDSTIRRTGAMRAESGVAAPDMVNMTLLAQRMNVVRLVDLAVMDSVSDELIIEMLQYLDSWMAWQTRALLDGHRDAELAAFARETRRRDRAAKRLLSGGLTAVEAAESAAECGLDPRNAYLVICVPTPTGFTSSEVRRELATVGLAASDRGAFTYLYGDFCAIVPDLPRDDVRFPVGVSQPVALSDLAEGYRIALRCAEAGRLLGIQGFISIRDLSVAAALTVDNDVVRVLENRYIAPLLELGSAGEAILETVRTFLDSQRSVTATSKVLFVHVNTIRYRLGRFEALTQSSFHDIRTIVEVWWILQAHPRSAGVH